MVQLDYTNERFTLTSMMGPQVQLLINLLQDVKKTIIGHKVTLVFPGHHWNVSILRKNLGDAYMTHAAEAQLKATVLTYNVPGSPERKKRPSINWAFRRTPFDHQLHTFNYFIANPNAAGFLDMGLGKTYIAAEYMDYLNQKVSKKPSLVVIPKSSFETWEREFAEIQSPLRVVRIAGSPARKRAQLAREADVYLIVYESVRNLLPQLIRMDWGLIVLDESTKIKNANSERAKALYALAPKAARRVILTGSPITQSYVDIFGQYRFLDPTVFGNSFFRFRAQYCVMGGFDNKQIVNYTNLDKLVEKIYSRAISYKAEECLDLPEKIYKVYKYDLSNPERRAYDALKKELTLKWGITNDGEVEITHSVSAQNALVAGMRLVQICSGYIGGVTEVGEFTSEFRDLGESKLDLFQEVMEEVPRDDRALVWVRFRRDLERVADRCRKMGLSFCVFHGDLNETERKQIITDFQNGKYKVFIGTTAAGSHGITLTRANVVVYYSQDYSVEKRVQSEKRAHRIGQTKPVLYVDLVARQSIEESIYKVIQQKGSAAEFIKQNPIKFLEGEAA